MTNSLEMELNTDTVPSRYQNINEVSTSEYKAIKLTKFEPDEKDISIIYIRLRKPSRDVRVGWLIPAISLISVDHDYSEDLHFIKYASNIFDKYKDQAIDERTYFFVWFNETVESNKINLYDYILDFTKFGIYPLESEHSKYINSLSLRVTKEITLQKRFDFRIFNGFVRELYSKTLQNETNLYARFMQIYQVIELSMDLALQAKMMEFKDSRKHMGIIRDKLTEYFKEAKLIGTVYDFTNNSNDITNLRVEANAKLKQSTGKNYSTERKEVAIYDFRNMLVHNYYRFKDDVDITIFCDHIERDALDILTKMTEEKYYNSELKARYYTESAK